MHLNGKGNFGNQRRKQCNIGPSTGKVGKEHVGLEMRYSRGEFTHVNEIQDDLNLAAEARAVADNPCKYRLEQARFAQSLYASSPFRAQFRQIGRQANKASELW